jgi:hypothetical protein
VRSVVPGVAVEQARGGDSRNEVSAPSGSARSSACSRALSAAAWSPSASLAAASGTYAMTSPRESQPQRYQIRVRGRLGQTICSAFPVLQARADGGNTVLTGVLADQAALYGVLAEAEALGLELIEVRRLPPDEPEEPSP